MKLPMLLITALGLYFTSAAQHTIPLRHLWAKPQVHVFFEGYIISFTIEDINKSLALLAATGDTAYGISSGLDTSGNYNTELFPGPRMEYKFSLQRILQRGVGAFLLAAGHANIENPARKKLKEIGTDMQPLLPGANVTTIKFYDPANGKLIFEGTMNAAMYHKDLGID